MKFEHNGLRFEASHIDHVVIKSVRRLIQPAQGGKPAHVTNEKVRVEEKGTRVWFRFNLKHGIRWAKFRYHGTIPESTDILGAEQYGSHEEMQKTIQQAMMTEGVSVWFSGTYVNIEICENWQEVQKIKAQEERRKSRSRAAKILRSPNIGNILQDAIQKSTAQFRQEAIDTPFGPIPVMTITGSSRRK